MSTWLNLWENLSGILFWFHAFFKKTEKYSTEKYLSFLYAMVEELLSLRLFVFVVEVAL